MSKEYRVTAEMSKDTAQKMWALGVLNHQPYWGYETFAFDGELREGQEPALNLWRRLLLESGATDIQVKERDAW